MRSSVDPGEGVRVVRFWFDSMRASVGGFGGTTSKSDHEYRILSYLTDGLN